MRGYDAGSRSVGRDGMNSPIVDFLRNYAAGGGSRLHMPGHKGKEYLGFERYDITEVSGADVLYRPEGIILESENNAAELFSTLHTYYSAEGSTLAIKAMLKLATEGVASPLVLAGRNAHRAFLSASALIGFDVEWIYPTEGSHLSVCDLTPSSVESAISECVRKPSAVYVTSPDYLGRVADIEGISKVCKRHGIPLLVDNAHGAYLAFLDDSRHPIALGAAMCADSAHKTLPAITGGAYLHVSRDYPQYTEGARYALSLFSSTSPSYLILGSLDMCNKAISDGWRYRLGTTVEKVEKLKGALSKIGIECEDSEPLKITVFAKRFGYTGDEISSHLLAFGIEPEFSDCEYTVLMVSPDNTDADLERIYGAFSNLPKRSVSDVLGSSLALPRLVRAVSIREAIFAPHEVVGVDDAVGRICATPAVSCPPAIPIAVSGEVIDESAVLLFQRYGIFEIEVVKETE